MDIRIARTDRAIEQAFMELREKNPLERIKIKDLCALACINKSTFYAHYEDIYALANALENKLVESILASVPHTQDDEALHQTDALTRELFQAFVQNQRAVNILFSGNRQGIFANSIELFHFSYQRYIENCLRETFGFRGTPVRIIIRERGDQE